MFTHYARDFSEILDVLSKDSELRAAVNLLAETTPMPGKVTEGEGRIDRFRGVLKGLVAGKLTLEQAYSEAEAGLPRSGSRHASDNRVFSSGWAERLVRTQLSRCYNQAVMEDLLLSGATECFVAHSPGESVDSKCSVELAGGTHDLQTLYDRLVKSYRDGVWTKDAKVPDHPHCTHTVAPVS